MTATIIPAQPGFKLLSLYHPKFDTPVLSDLPDMTEHPIIAWRIGDGRPVPVTASGIENNPRRIWAVEEPSGRASDLEGRMHYGRDAWVKHVRTTV